MPALTLRLPDELRKKLKILGATHDQSMHAEILAALNHWVSIEGDPKSGSKSRGRE